MIKLKGKKVQNMMTIDPGTSSMGWAYWYCLDDKAPRWVDLIITKQTTGINWKDRVVHQIENLWNSLEHVPVPDIVYCEMPEFFNSEGGRAAIGSGAIFKLVFLVGGLCNMFESHGIPFKLVPVREWKGQLPKDVVKDRIVRLLGRWKTTEYKQDIWDSVGLGLYIKGLL